jgi:hypothetical protein
MSIGKWPHLLFKEPKKGFTIWQWQKGKWTRIRQYCVKGYRSGDPPEKPGKYECEIKLQLCVKKIKPKKNKRKK